MRKIILTTIVAVSCLALASCAKKPTDNMGPDAMSGQSANGDSTQAYGAGSQNGYTDSNGFHINSLRAPSNQVYYFALDSNVVRQSDYKAINIQANYLASHGSARIRLEGNTDERGSREYNVALGWRRAQAVQQLFTQQGVSSGQIQMISYGKERPAAFGHDEHSWALNRRVELKYKAN